MRPTLSFAPPSGVVFDLDGTLVDSRGDIVAACLHTLATHGRRPRSAEEIASFVGDGARLLVSRAAGLEPTAPELDPLLETYLAYYAAHSHDETVLMPGALEALDAVSDLPLALCTFKPRASTEPLLAHLGLRGRFSAVIAGEDVTAHKPNPDPLIEIARRLELPCSQLVMVGDGPQDIECGRRAGARTVGVPGPFLARERLVSAAPDVLLDHIGQLPEQIARWRAA